MGELQIPIPGYTGSLRCRVEGHGPVLVIQAPGWGTGAALFEQTLAPLLQDCTVVTFDPRGSGASPGDWPEPEITVSDHADDLHAVTRHLGLDRFSVLGHSHGAWIALQHAIRHPETLDRLILVGAETDHADGFEEAQMAFIESRRSLPGWNAACSAFMQALDGGFEEMESDSDLVRWFGSVLPLYAHDPPALARAFGRCELPPFRLRAFRAAAQTNHLFHVLPQLHRIDCPTLVITGTAEWTGIRMLADRLVAGLPRGTSRDIDAAGHFPWLERPRAFCDAVLHFLLSDADRATKVEITP